LADQIRQIAGMTTEEPLGLMARRIFAVQRRSPYRQVHTRFRKNFWVRFHRLDNLGRMRFFTAHHHRIVTEQRGIGLGRQLLDQWNLVFVHGVDPATYYAHHLYDAPAGLHEVDHYLGRNEMKNGLYSLLCELRRGQSGFGLTLSEKAIFSAACRKAGLPIVPALAVISKGDWKFTDPAAGVDVLDGDLFVKTVRGKGAAGAMAYLWCDGRYVTKTGDAFDKAALHAHLTERSREQALLVTRRMVNYPEIADLAEQSLLTFRVFTVLDQNGEPVVTHGMLRVLAKLEPNWNTTEEFAAPIDVESGRLGKIWGDRMMAPDGWWDRHPKTGATVTGRVIANWPAIAALAVRAHRVFNGRVVIGWDLALTPDGPFVIEGNSDADTHFLQRVHRQMIGRSRMEPLLRHHLLAAERLLAGTPTSPSAP
jgi:hypothetical protein